ncbi:hypothetical protein RHSIM_RhsimUnG0097200 [Rhododendron simsii]|uniref:Aminotransferase-like plant mobile domain-containing protein n=1 Tax=Rhododendron simsii TaxID=118357 RepID=A0A834L2M3_RHOSS|nr:hypothetical protein RHSIM_RhsimUnG0097200 [Rhododendron simsii]
MSRRGVDSFSLCTPLSKSTIDFSCLDCSRGYIMDGFTINPGPTDGSLLVLQKQHRSCAVWEGYGDSKVENVTLITRRNDNNLRQLGRPSPRIVELIYQAGEATITLQDVEIITGLAVDGRPVTGDSRFDDDKKKELCDRLLGLNPPGEVMSGFKVSLKWLRDNFNGKVDEGDDEVTILRKARGYILQLIGGIVLPDQSSSHVHLYFLSLLDDLQLAGTYSWGSTCLATLYHYLDFGSTVGSKDLGGMCVLLQVWGWERFPFLAPARNGKRAIRRDSPLSGRWDDEFHSPNLPTHIVGHYRFSLDVQRPDEVVWQPYPEDLIQSLPRFCSAGRGVWMASVPLIQFSHVEQHQPEQNWSKPIRLWNNRANSIVNITNPDILVYPADDPYPDWYERITLRFVSKMGAATYTAMQLFERLSMPNLSAEAVQSMAQKGVECLKFQEKLFRKIAPEHKIRDPQEQEEFDEDYDRIDPHLQAEAGVHQQNQPLSQHQHQGPPEDTHADYQYEEPVATSSLGGPVHPSELSTPFSSALLNMDGVSMSPLLNYSPTAGARGSQLHTPSDFDWANMQISTVGGGETISECRSLLKRKRIVESQDGDSVGQVTQLTERVVQQPNGPSYAGGTVILLSIPRGITLTDLRQFISNAGRLPSAMMKITYAYPTLSFPHTMYTYVGVEVVDDNGVNIIFDVADGDDTCFAYDMHDDSTIFEQHNDYVKHDSAFDNNLGDDDEVSQSSEEDVDEGLEAEDREEHEIPEFETPSSMFTDDTWTNIVDPSPQMPNKSHVGWDGHCELFKGQVRQHEESVPAHSGSISAQLGFVPTRRVYHGHCSEFRFCMAMSVPMEVSISVGIKVRLRLGLLYTLVLQKCSLVLALIRACMVMRWSRHTSYFRGAKGKTRQRQIVKHIVAEQKHVIPVMGEATMIWSKQMRYQFPTSRHAQGNEKGLCEEVRLPMYTFACNGLLKSVSAIIAQIYTVI